MLGDWLALPSTALIVKRLPNTRPEKLIVDDSNSRVFLGGDILWRFFLRIRRCIGRIILVRVRRSLGHVSTSYPESRGPVGKIHTVIVATLGTAPKSVSACQPT